MIAGIVYEVVNNFLICPFCICIGGTTQIQKRPLAPLPHNKKVGSLNPLTVWGI